MARFDTSHDLVPLGGVGTYTSTSCSGGDCPATTYTQTITEPGASQLQLNMDISGIDPCSDYIQVQGNGAGDMEETINGSTTGSYQTQNHLGNAVTVTLVSDTSQCASSCTCNSGSTGSGSGFQITSANVQYSPVTDQLGLSLPGMFNDGTGIMNNWNRYFVADLPAYLSPDPMKGVPRRLLLQGPGLLPELHRATGGPDGGAPHRRGAASRSDPAVGAGDAVRISTIGSPETRRWKRRFSRSSSTNSR